MTIECEFLWYTNNDIMVSSCPLACKLEEYPDQKQDYHLEWPYLEYVTVSKKTRLMGFFVKVEFYVWLISFQ